MKKKLITIILLVCFAVVATGLVLFFTLKPEISNDNTSNPPETEIQNPTTPPVFVVPEIINLYLSDQNVSVELYVEYDGDYFIEHAVEDSEILQINNGVVIPKKTGTTKVQTTLLYGENKILKHTIINVYKDLENVVCQVYKNNEIVDKLFVGEKYNLKLTLDTPIIGDFEFCANKNIDDFKFVEQKQNEYYYEFTAASLGNTEFLFNFKNAQNKFIYQIYSYIEKFDVYVNDKLHNQDFLQLFLYNKEFETQANEDGFFDKIKLEIEITHSCVANCFEIVYAAKTLKYENGYLWAENVGIYTMLIKANDGSEYSQEIKIIVKNIEPTQIVANDIYASVGEPKILEYSVLPQYAIYTCEVQCSQFVYIDNNTITALESGEHEITIIANKISKTIKFITKENPKINIDISQIIVDELNVEVSQQTIKLNFVENYLFAFSYYFTDDKNNIISKNLDVEIMSENQQVVSNLEHENLRILFCIKQKANFSIKFLDGTNVYYQINFEFY